MRFFLHIVLGLALFSAPLRSAEIETRRDIFYTEAKNPLQSLDVYAPKEGQNHPVVVWIHGGGWKKGDKASVQTKPQNFTSKGYVLVSINYRFLPDVTLKEMMGDVAKALRWVHDHVAESRGDPNSIVVLGHSAGAHLAALVCTDDRYLRAEGLSLKPLKGCVPIDVSAYDVPKRMQDGGSSGITNSFISVFGKEETTQRDFSPVYHVARNKNIPPFLILHVASRDDTKAQAHWLADKLTESGIRAEVVAAEGKTHGSIGTDLSTDGDVPTQKLWQFLDRVVPKP